MSIRQVVFSAPPPEFGELKETPEFNDEHGMNGDATYVPGFSELRYKRDTAINKVMRGELRANEVPTLPHNFRWVRCQNVKGEPDSRKVVRAGNRGYRAVTQEDVGPGKLVPSLPAGSAVKADGTVRLGDVQLMIADAQQVARNEFAKRVRTETTIRGAEAGFEAALESMGGRRSDGASPFIQKEVGRPVRAELTEKLKK